MAMMTMREALRDAMAEEMRRDETVYVMGEEVAEYQGAYKVTQGLLQEFGERRVVDTPITEHGFAGVGVGAGFAGLKPIVEFMTFNFAMQAIDQIVNSAAKTLYMSGGQMGCSIVFRGPNGAAARVAAQHSQDYSAWYSQIPGLKVVAPYSAADAKGLLKAAIRDPNPVIFLENEILYGHSGEVPKLDDYVLPIGKARIVRSGKDVTLIAWSHAMTYALKAADELAKEGIEAEIIDLRTIRPMDTETLIASVKKTGRAVVVEEGWQQSGVGVGAAMAGLKPIVEFMTFNFAMQAMDQIINSAAKTRYMSGGQMAAPIVFRGPNGIASRVAAQHSQCFASWYAHVPGLKVVAPYTGADYKGLLKSAIRDPNPVIFLEHELVYGESFPVPEDPEYLVPIGKARIARVGEHVTIAAFSRMVKLALQAAGELESAGISAEVIDLRSLRPFDVGTIVESVKKTNRIVSVEEGWPFAGIGAEIAAIVMEECFDWLDAPLKRVTGKDVPLPYAANLERLATPQVEDIVVAAREVTYR
jgi:pyruvate/2-oxoglutarate/acetoin dehydrogenase E1 component